jgi:hypothetical protein
MNDEKKQFEAWAIVELFGHQRISGRVSEQTVGGCAFVRVDVPETKKAPAFTRLFGQGAIYSIIITDERSAKLAAEGCTPEPMERWTVDHLLKELPEARKESSLVDPGESF